MSSKELIRILKHEGWYIARIKGSHHHFLHDSKKGIVTIPHPKKDIPIGTLRATFNQAQIKQS